MRYLTSDLIDAVKRNAVIPESQRKFQDPDFIALLNEELELQIEGDLLDLNEEYFVKPIDIPLVTSTSSYLFPPLSAAWRFRDIGYVDANNIYTSLTVIPLEYIDRYRYSSDSKPLYLYLTDANINTIPDINTNPIGSIRVYYERIQNALIKETECGEITSVFDTGTDYQLSVDNVPTASTVDVISGTMPYGVLASQKAATTGPLLVTVSKANFERAPVIGDFVAPTGYTPVAHIPEEFNPVLAMSATIRYLAGSGDAKGLQTQSMIYQKMLTSLKQRAKNRTKGAPKKIRPKDKILNIMRGRIF